MSAIVSNIIGLKSILELKWSDQLLKQREMSYIFGIFILRFIQGAPGGLLCFLNFHSHWVELSPALSFARCLFELSRAELWEQLHPLSVIALSLWLFTPLPRLCEGTSVAIMKWIQITSLRIARNLTCTQNILLTFHWTNHPKGFTLSLISFYSALIFFFFS